MYRRVYGRESFRRAGLCATWGVGYGRNVSVLPVKDSVEILGIDGMTREELGFELQRGGKFVTYQFCASTFTMACSATSDVFFYRVGECAAREIFHYCTASMLLGWWGLPWGPVFTIRSLITNIKGGKDVTQEVLAFLEKQSA